MIARLSHTTISFLLIFSLIYTPVLIAAESQLSLPSGDLVAPEVKHQSATENVKEGQPAKISATVTDNVGVQSVILFYRTKGATGEYKRVVMQREANTDVYSTELENIENPGLEYYIQASDLAGNTLLHGHSFSPLSFAVIPGAAGVAAAGSDSAGTGDNVEAAINEASESSSKSNMKWVWIGLGVLAVGALAGGGGGGGGGTSGTPSGGDTNGIVTIDASAPQN